MPLPWPSSSVSRGENLRIFKEGPFLSDFLLYWVRSLSPPRNPPARPGPKSIHGHGRTRHTVRTRTASSTHRPRRARTLCVHTACAMAPAATPRKPRCCPAARSLAPSGRAASSFKTNSLSLSLSLTLHKTKKRGHGPGPHERASQALREPEPEREPEREREGERDLLGNNVHDGGVTRVAGETCHADPSLLSPRRLPERGRCC